MYEVCTSYALRLRSVVRSYSHYAKNIVLLSHLYYKLFLQQYFTLRNILRRNNMHILKFFLKLSHAHTLLSVVDDVIYHTKILNFLLRTFRIILPPLITTQRYCEFF